MLALVVDGKIRGKTRECAPPETKVLETPKLVLGTKNDPENRNFGPGNALPGPGNSLGDPRTVDEVASVFCGLRFCGLRFLWPSVTERHISASESRTFLRHIHLRQ